MLSTSNVIPSLPFALQRRMSPTLDSRQCPVVAAYHQAKPAMGRTADLV